MSLTECPECRRSVSDRAAACPHCGHPINPKAGEPVLRELRRWRASMPMMAGLVLFVAGLAMPRPLFAVLGVVLFIIGWFRYRQYKD